MKDRRCHDPSSPRGRRARAARRLFAAVPAVVAVAALAGCGELGADWRGLRVQPPAKLTLEDLARYPAGSPERAFTGWFAAVQRRDAAAAARAYAPSAQVSPTVLAIWWHSVPPPTAASPRIADVDRHGRLATVFVVMTTRYVAPNGREVAFRVPQAMTLVRSGGAWRVPGNWFLASLTEAQEAQRRKVEAGAL